MELAIINDILKKNIFLLNIYTVAGYFNLVHRVCNKEYGMCCVRSGSLPLSKPAREIDQYEPAFVVTTY